MNADYPDLKDVRLGEQVPLLRPWKEDQSGIVSHKNSWTIFFGWLKHLLIHLVMYSFFSILFMLGYHKVPKTLVFIATFLFFAFLSDAVFIHTRRNTWTMHSLGFGVCAFAILMGSLSGISIQFNNLADYWPYYHMRHYTNVAPDEPAASHADASVLVFMPGARPDSSRSMGYTRYTNTYCAAPIALEAGYADDATIVSDIQYWAVGKDCCRGNQGFTCGDAANPKARTGLVKSTRTISDDDDSFLTSALSNEDMKYYEKAVLMTESKFDITSPKERMYVQFVEDIAKARDADWFAAWWVWFMHTAIIFPIFVVAGLVTVVIGAGDPQDNNRYSDHAVDLKQNVLQGINHWI